ncbi:hypothetical protein HYDPIDRAFT_115794 [Hydnomerulius pinastri MD-312]|uniref:Uncharacterized protein n=1 Tax=Hydnomerulius pinastri MD-312 TaxID=994086 RepID=A0A0C9W500_9AGAM|nr:hypothetical protein HYDPIDRAFT_115794 [Hydnomerulius pinastri MD-312]
MSWFKFFSKRRNEGFTSRGQQNNSPATHRRNSSGAIQRPSQSEGQSQGFLPRLSSFFSGRAPSQGRESSRPQAPGGYHHHVQAPETGYSMPVPSPAPTRPNGQRYQTGHPYPR